MIYLSTALCLILARLIPHAPGFTPIYALVLLLGTLPNRKLAYATLLSTFILSDLSTSLLYNTPAFGDWTVFVYSGFALMFHCGKLLKYNNGWQANLFTTASACTLFWLWTNFGTWFTTLLYPQSLAGLVTCYFAAIPFLTKSLLITVLCVTVLMTKQKFLEPYLRHR